MKEKSPEKIAEYYGMDGGTKTEGQLLARSHILHFAGVDRPWEIHQYYFTDLYLSYFRQSPYGGMEVFQPYKRKREILYLFPYESVEKGSRVILYGAGIVGKDYFIQIQKTEYCRLVSWTDSGWKGMEDYDYGGTMYRICEPLGALCGGEQYDICVVAVLKKEVYAEIRKRLLEIGVPEKKIIWKKPQYVSISQ